MKRLNAVLPSVWSHSNPVDLIGDAPPERYKQTIDICLEDPDIDGAVVILTPQAMTRPTEVAQAVIDAASQHDKPVMTSWMGGAQVAEARRLFNAAHLPNYTTVENAIDAFSYLARYNRNQRMLLQTPGRLTTGQRPPDVDGARLIIESVINERRNTLTEPESLAVLNAFHIPTVRSGVARSANEALIVGETIGYPVAMKVLSTDITHKSDAGGVRLNINSAHEIRSVFRQRCRMRRLTVSR
jgi:acetyltransferase